MLKLQERAETGFIVNHYVVIMFKMLVNFKIVNSYGKTLNSPNRLGESED